MGMEVVNNRSWDNEPHLQRYNTSNSCTSGSLVKFVKEVTNKKSEGKSDSLMKFEWARYATFEKFPASSVASPLRLAKYGFYYTGKKEVAKCFCCKQENGKWTDDESILETHTRLSPDCKFINGQDNTNVPVGSDRSQTALHLSGACGGPDDVAVSRNAKQSRTRQETKHDRTKEHIKETFPVQEASSHDEDKNKKIEKRNEEDKNKDVFTTTTTYHSSTKARYPQYSSRISRLASFQHWPCSYISKDSLADAGLFYAGVQDCVRCFQCGGGLRNWDEGDEPWTEHARWFPDCDFIKQNFQAAAKNEDIIETKNSPGVGKLIEMGYTITDIEDALQQLRHMTELTRFTTQTVIDRLLDGGRDVSHEIGVSENEIVESGERRNPDSLLGDEPVLRRNNSEPRLSSEALLRNSEVPEDASKEKSTFPGQKEQLERRCSSDPEIDRERDDICTGTGVEHTVCDETKPANKSQNLKEALQEENKQLKEQMMCKICWDSDACVVFTPCGHMVSCIQCAKNLKKCPICRERIQGRIRAFPS